MRLLVCICSMHINTHALPAFGNITNLIGQDFCKLMHLIWPKAKACEIVNQFRHTLKTGEPCIVNEFIEEHFDLKRSDLNHYDLNISKHYFWQINRIRLPDGSDGVVCYFQDISDRILAKQKLSENEESYHHLFNSIDEGFCIIEVIFDAHKKPVDYRFLEVNSAFKQQSGLINATGKRILELAPNINQYFIETYGRVCTTGEPIRFMHEAQALERWFDVYAFRVGGPDSLKVAVLFNNVTAKKLHETKLLVSEERLQAFVMSTADVIYTMNPDWSVMHQLHGRDFIADCNEASASWLENYIPISDQPAVLAAIKKAIAKKDIFQLEHRVIRVDQTLGWASSRAVPLKNDVGEVTEWFGAATDITYRKQVEELLVMNNMELKEAKLIAEKANFAKSEFLSSMSHELRTPLNAILGFAQLLESSTPPPSPTQTRSIEQILQGGWYLLELVNEILDLAQIESGKAALNLENLTLLDMMQQCADMIAPLAEKHGISLHFNELASNIMVHADKLRLKQIIINLLSNAIKYNKPSGTVKVDYYQQVGSIKISVVDSGEGLSQAQLAQLFQPFNRLGQNNSAKEGTGIGLVVSKRLVELMQGKIGVNSQVNRGSEFWIELNSMAEPDAVKTGLITGLDTLAELQLKPSSSHFEQLV